MASSKKRPTGITIIAVLWTLGSIYNIYQSLDTIITDLGILPYLSDPMMPEWFGFGVPAEAVIGFLLLAFAFLTLLVVYGLWTARSWSYHFALAVPVIITIMNIATIGLYASAPVALGLGEAVVGVIPTIVGNIVLLAIIWSYLPKPHVKQYLNVTPTPAPAPVPMPPPPEPIAATEGKKFCRYCGAENKNDAVFCEKCGKEIG